jgi:cytochrome oxidase assembly protein ShyY1
VDIAAMSKATNLSLEPLTLEIIQPDAPADIYPIPSDGKVVLRNDHLGYAITWYGIALVAAVIGFLRFRTKRI